MNDFYMILIGIIGVIVLLLKRPSSSGKNDESYYNYESYFNNESYSLVVENVISLLETLQKFYKG